MSDGSVQYLTYKKCIRIMIAGILQPTDKGWRGWGVACGTTPTERG